MHGSNKNPDGQARRNGIGSGVGVSVFIFCFALLMRLFYLYGARQAPTFLVPIIDSQSYLELARRMVAHLPTGAQMYWQPVFYPAFLATVIALFGESLWLIKIIQAVIGASTCVLLYWTGRLGLSAREGLLAGLLMALYGPVLFFESELLGEGWALFWVCALLLSFLLAERTDHPLRYALAGLIGGCAVLTRPPLLMVFVFCALRLCWVQYRRTNLREAFACGGLILIAFAVICSHTAYRCKAVTGKLSFLPHSAGINLYIGNNPDWRETVCARPGYEWQRLCNLPTDAGVTNEWAASGFFQQEVKHYALEHPGLFIRGLLHKTVRFFNAREMPRNISIYTYREWSPLLALTTWKIGGFGFPFGLLFPLALVGLLWNIRRISVPILACLFMYPPVIILYFVSARYRLLWIPAMLLVAATGITALYDACRERRVKRIAGGTAVILTAAALTSFPARFHEETIDYRAEMYWALGHQHIEKLAFGNALPYLEQALRLNPNLVPAINDLSLALVETGEPEHAMGLSERALALDPAEANLYYNSAIIFLENKQAARAEQRIREAIKRDPNQPLAHYYLGMALLEQQRWEEALEALEMEQALRPENPMVRQMCLQVRKAIEQGGTPQICR